MKIANISVTDWAGSVNGMSLEEEGFFWRMTRLMYANDGVFYDDDRGNASLMNINIRIYKRLKERLLNPAHASQRPVIFQRDGKLVNERVVKEIERFCQMHKAKIEGGHEGARRRWDPASIDPADKIPANLPEVSLKFAGSLPEVSPKLRDNLASEINKINDLGIGQPNTPFSSLQKTERIPPSPQRGDDGRGLKFSASRAASKADPKPDRFAKDPFKFRHDAEGEAEATGIKYNENGNLEVFNGTKVEMLKLVGGDEEQMKLDLLTVQGTNKVGPSMHPLMLKSKALGAMAELVARRRDSDRRYQQAAASNQQGRRGATPNTKTAVDDLPATRDESEISRRFEMVAALPRGQKAIAEHGREAMFAIFRRKQLERAGVQS